LLEDYKPLQSKRAHFKELTGLTSNLSGFREIGTPSIEFPVSHLSEDQLKDNSFRNLLEKLP